MKKDIVIIIIIIAAFAILFATTMLFDVEFIKAHGTRQYLVYILMLLELFVTLRLLQIIIKG
jgi:hypothetical protein